MNSKKSQVCLKICRYDPQKNKEPFYQSYYVPLTEEKMNLLQALEYIYQEQDDTLAFRRYSCGLQYCNSCMMLINGKPGHACLYIIEPETEVEVAPLKKKRILCDLIVDVK